MRFFNFLLASDAVGGLSAPTNKESSLDGMGPAFIIIGAFATVAIILILFLMKNNKGDK